MSSELKAGSSSRTKAITKRSFAAAFASPESKKNKKTNMTENLEENQELANELRNGVEGLKSPVKLWTDTQEIDILNGMIEYMKTKGTDPMANKDDLHVFIMESFIASEKRTVKQLVDKIYKLKKKYLNKSRNYSKPHDLQCYELVKILWPEAGSSIKNKSTKVGKKNQTEDEISPPPICRDSYQGNDGGRTRNHIALDGPLVFCNSSFADQILVDAAGLVTGSRKNELEEESKNLKLKGLELFLMETNVLRKQTEIVMESIKSQQA